MVSEEKTADGQLKTHRSSTPHGVLSQGKPNDYTELVSVCGIPLLAEIAHEEPLQHRRCKPTWAESKNSILVSSVDRQVVWSVFLLEAAGHNCFQLLWRRAKPALTFSHCPHSCRSARCKAPVEDCVPFCADAQAMNTCGEPSLGDGYSPCATASYFQWLTSTVACDDGI